MSTYPALEAALKYAAWGWPVLPAARSKQPLYAPVLFEHGFKSASKDEALIRAWWDLWPDANVGIATGVVSGIVVLDVDPRNGGDESLAKLVISETLTARTGGGGRHFLFRADGPCRSRKGWPHRGLDIKADGGYIVAPPSIHKSGNLYEWVDLDALIAAMDDWLKTGIQREPECPVIPFAGTFTGTDKSVEDLRVWVRDNCRDSIQGQDGNGAMMRVASQVGAQVRAGKATKDDGWQVIQEHNARAVPRWGDAPLWKAFNKMIVHSKKKPLPERSPMHAVRPPDEASGLADHVDIPDESWAEGRKIEGKAGRWLACTENAITVLSCHPLWRRKVRQDSFANLTRVTDPPWSDIQVPSAVSDVWSDDDDTRLQGWLLRDPGMKLTTADCARAVAVVAAHNAYNPAQDYMNALKWDGKDRLSRWLVDYFGAEDTRYTRSVGRMWLISAVARVFTPGDKVDTVLVLEGKQGTFKSSALAELCPNPDWFTEIHIDPTNKDTMQQLQGRLIVELGELSGLSRADQKALKSFFSRRDDDYRAPYAKRNKKIPRGCVFAGTTNANEYLPDDTGNRRYWPVACAGADRDTLRRDRDQLWAEAVAAFQAGEHWWASAEDKELLEEIRCQQDVRYVSDAWEDPIAAWIVRQSKAHVTVEDVLSGPIEMKLEKHDQSAQNRVAKVLKRLGWTRHKRTIDGVLKWRYYPSTPPVDPVEY